MLGINQELDFLDLAAEAHKLLLGKEKREVAGVRQEIFESSGSKVNIIEIFNQTGVINMRRPLGNYITIENNLLKDLIDEEAGQSISQVLATELKKLMPHLAIETPILIVGLGNDKAISDALGPQVAGKILPTTHFYDNFDSSVTADLQKVAVFCPDVLGNTGIESVELIKGVIGSLKPQLVIVIDALAAGSIGRISTSIQLTDTGIRPGSGLKNNRAEINTSTLGVPTIAIGIPTVVHGRVIINETLDSITHGLPYLEKEIHNGIKNAISEHLLSPFDGDLLVTPKDIDRLVPHIAEIVAIGLIMAIHSDADIESYRQYLN